jgi:hypothetical protein
MLCEGDSTILDAGGGYASYLWSNGDTTEQVAARKSGDYSVRVTSQYGCEGHSDTVHVYVVPRPAPVVTGAGEFCPGDSAVLDAGPGYASYLWSNGATGQQLVVKTSGTFGVTVTNANDCAASSAMVTVRAKPGPAKPVITHVDDTLTSTSEFSYQWFFEGQPVAGADSQRYVIPKPGTYTMEVTNDEGCKALSDPVTIYWAEAQIELGQYEAVPGEQLKIPIRISNSVNLDNIPVDGYTLTLRFNKSLLHPINATPIGVVDGRDRVITFSGRRAGVNEGEIGLLEFTAALGDTTETILDIESFRWLDGSGLTKTIDGNVRIDPQGGWKLYLPTGRLRLLPPHPNPTADMAQIVYETIEPGHVRLYLVDVLGRRVTSLVNGEIATGIHQLPFDPTGYPSGSYLLILETPSARLMQPMQIQH